MPEESKISKAQQKAVNKYSSQLFFREKTKLILYNKLMR